MVRRDYIIRMIEQFFQLLNRLQSLKKDQRLDEATTTLDDEFKRLVGSGADGITRFSETELLAKLIQGEPTLAVREKTLMLATLLKEAGDVGAAQERMEDSRAYYLK